jgi:hypothetical protein
LDSTYSAKKKMSPLPSPSSIALVTRIIAETFDVTEVEARENAEGLVAIADGWGGPGAAPADWALEVKKYFGERLKWRSGVDRQRFLDEKKTTISAYENYIRARK